MDSRTIYMDYLAHYGVKGMRWGVRKQEYNKNYSEAQRKRDKAVYGGRAVNRINKAMNQGQTISGARSKEAQRINTTRRRAQTAGQVGSTAGKIVGGLAGYVASKKVAEYMQNKYPEYMDEDIANIMTRSAISYGASTVGAQLGRYGAQSVTMILGGYSPDKYRR